MQLFTKMTILSLSLFLAFQVNAATIQLPKTGQTTSYADGDDGALQKGVVWPNQRLTDNGNGTVTDNLTKLIWLKNANCSANLGGVNNPGGLNWPDAIAWANALASGACGLTDSSKAGDWRLPNITELESLFDPSNSISLPTGHPFTGVKTGSYWSSSSCVDYTTSAWIISLSAGKMHCNDKNFYDSNGVWPVRGGQ